MKSVESPLIISVLSPPVTPNKLTTETADIVFASLLFKSI